MADEQRPGATVAPEDGVKEGWWGTSPVHKDREDYTVAGVTGGTANVTDQPDPAAEQRVRQNTEPLRGAGKDGK